MPLSIPLPQLKRELEDLLLDLQYLATALQRLRDLLPESSEKRVTVVTLLGRLNDANKKALRQVLDDHALQIEYNAIRSDLLDLIAGLEDADFQESAKQEPANPNASGKQGSVLYRIPHAMPLRKETECVVRIAINEDAIVEDITIDKQVVLKNLSRISDLMQVELTDPSRDPVFSIRSTSAAQQLITGDGYTQWFFYVEPLQEGVHSLEVKVCVLEMAFNQIARKEIVFRETIEIYTEGQTPADAEESLPATQMPAAGFKKAGDALAFQGPPTGNSGGQGSKSAEVVDTKEVAPVPPYIDAPTELPPDIVAEREEPPAPEINLPDEAPEERTSGRSMRAVAFALAFLVFGISATWAFTPAATRDWWVASIQDTPEAYDSYISRHPEATYAEKAYYFRAERSQRLADWRAYEHHYPEGQFRTLVADRLNTMESNEINNIKNQPTIENVERFASDFPNSNRLTEIKAAAESRADHKDELLAAVEDAYVNSTKIQPTAEKVKDYLHDFPNATHLDEVHAAAASNPQVFAKVQPQLEDAFLKKMENNPTPAKAEEFLDKFPEPVQKEKFEKILDKRPAAKQTAIRKMRKLEETRNARELKNTTGNRSNQ